MWEDTVLLGLVGVKCFTSRDAVGVRWDLQSSGDDLGGEARERLRASTALEKEEQESSRLWWSQGCSSLTPGRCVPMSWWGPRPVFISCAQASKLWLLPPPIPSEECPVPLSVC